MRKLSLIMLAACFFIACKDETKFVVNGNFEHASNGSKVYLYGLDNGQMLVVDSTTLSENGSFKFSRSSPEPSLYRIILNEKNYMIIAGNGDEVSFKADLDDPKMGYELKGAEDAEKLEILNSLKNEYAGKIDKIQAEFDAKVSAEPDKRDLFAEQLLPSYNAQIDEMNKAFLKFANENSTSLVSFYAVSQVNPENNEQELVAYAEKIKGKFKNNTTVDMFIQKMETLKAVQVGQHAPEFSIRSIDGKTINLSDFKGKYVLLDFWASWCQPCRIENPNIVAAFNKYKNKNFTVFGISLDKDEAAWNSAVKEDKLTWAHASDLADFDSKVALLYQIEAIPSSFLLDPEGKIIAKNLRGADLEKFLEKTLH